MYKTDGIEVKDIIIEVTRRCNMVCEHCLRGDAQNVDIKNEYIRTFFEVNKIKKVGNILFSGGEPSLNVPAMNYTLEVCKTLGISVNTYRIITNGKKRVDGFIECITEWEKYINFKHFTYVYISRDIFHSDQDKEWIWELRNLVFCSDYNLDYLHFKVINEGKGIDYNRAHKIERPINNAVTIYYYSDVQDIISDIKSGAYPLYLNALGDVLVDYCLSYENQKKYNIGNVMKKSLIEMIKDCTGVREKDCQEDTAIICLV